MVSSGELAGALQFRVIECTAWKIFDLRVHQHRDTTVCDEVTYVCLTIVIAKKIRRAPPNAPISLESANGEFRRPIPWMQTSSQSVQH